MSRETTLIGIILLLVFIGPVIFILFQQKLKQNKKRKILKNLSDEHNLFFDYKEITGLYILGLDSKAGKLVYLQPEASDNYKLIELNENTTCHLDYKETANSHKELIALKIGNKNKQLPQEQIIFYDDASDTNMVSEVQFIIAKKWDKIIKDNLN